MSAKKPAGIPPGERLTKQRFFDKKKGEDCA